MLAWRTRKKETSQTGCERGVERACSMNVQASRSVSAILSRTATTARRRRQNAAVDSRSSCTRLFFVVITPMLYSLPRARA